MLWLNLRAHRYEGTVRRPGGAARCRSLGWDDGGVSFGVTRGGVGRGEWPGHVRIATICDIGPIEIPQRSMSIVANDLLHSLAGRLANRLTQFAPTRPDLSKACNLLTMPRSKGTVANPHWIMSSAVAEASREVCNLKLYPRLSFRPECTIIP
jgi:hypothetical protein